MTVAHPYPKEFSSDRGTVEAAIEAHLDEVQRLIAILDQLEGDTDIESDPCDGPIDDEELDGPDEWTNIAAI